jgi:HNH endonuclease
MAIRSRSITSQRTDDFLPPEPVEDNTLEPEKLISAKELNLNPSWWQKDETGKAKYQRYYEYFCESLANAFMSQTGEECQVCGNKMRKNGKPGEQPILTYILPLDDGGTTGLDNVTLKCRKCSEEK